MAHRTGRARHLVLVGDVGGTFARFALARDGVLVSEPVRFERSAFPDLPSACRAYLEQAGACAIDGVAIAAAGRSEGERIDMTNADWTVATRELEAGLALPWSRALVLNDFGALAWVLPTLFGAELRAIGSAVDGGPAAERNRVVVGPGTGLGVAAAIGTRAGWHAHASEGGHASFAPETDFERAAGELAARRFGRASWERIVSGPGLALLHEAALAHLGLAPQAADPAAVLDAYRRGERAARLAVASFVELLGSFAGDLALLFDAGGGIVIAGGVVPRIAAIAPLEPMRIRFERKGRFGGWLARVPLSLLDSPFAALRGAALAYRS